MSDAREALVALLWEKFGAWPNGPLAAWLTKADCARFADAILAAGWTPPSARCCDPATIETRIDGDWLVDVHQHHTCGTGPDGHYGAHEPGCGRVPVVNLRELPGWTPPGERVKASVEDVARALWELDEQEADATGGALDVPWSALDSLTQGLYRADAEDLLALLPGRTETEVKAEAWDEVADYLDRTNAPSIAEAARRDNPYRKEQS